MSAVRLRGSDKKENQIDLRIGNTFFLKPYWETYSREADSFSNSNDNN